MIEQTATVAELFKALHSAQGSLTGVVKDGKNPAFKSRYATLEAVWDTVRPVLHSNGLAVTQSLGGIADGCLCITTTLAHTSGEWMRSTMHIPIVKRDPQGYGSASTYGLRYSLMAVLGVPPTDDDDGEAAMPDRNAQSPRQNGNRIEGPAPKPAEHGVPQRSSSQRAADEMCASLARVPVDRIDDWLGRKAVQSDLAWIDEADRQRVMAVADKRRAL